MDQFSKLEGYNPLISLGHSLVSIWGLYAPVVSYIALPHLVEKTIWVYIKAKGLKGFKWEIMVCSLPFIREPQMLFQHGLSSSFSRFLLGLI